MNRAELIKTIEAGYLPEFLFFWGHQVPDDGSVGPSCLSQWYPASFTVDNIPYNCAEQYMMAEKARYFGDSEIEAEILSANSPKEMKALGRKVRNFDATRWNSYKYQAVVKGNLHKFVQNEKFRDFLLATGNKIIVEASPRDCIWGIGLGKDNPAATDPNRWRGQNLLGFALMDVRMFFHSYIVADDHSVALARDPEQNCFVQWDLERRDPWEYNPLLGSIKKLRPKFTELSESARKFYEEQAIEQEKIEAQKSEPLIYPDFHQFEKNRSAVIRFLEEMPILRNGDRSINLEPEYYEIKPMPDPDICPSGSYWNLIPNDDWDAQEAAPEHNQRYYSDIQEYSTGAMWSYWEYKCERKDLDNWAYQVLENRNIWDKLRNCLYDRNDNGRYDIILADLHGILKSLIIYGEANDFSNGVEGDEYKLYCKIRKAYYAGGYPYGWTGDYPDKVKVLVHYDN